MRSSCRYTLIVAPKTWHTCIIKRKTHLQCTTRDGNSTTEGKGNPLLKERCFVTDLLLTQPWNLWIEACAGHLFTSFNTEHLMHGTRSRWLSLEADDRAWLILGNFSYKHKTFQSYKHKTPVLPGCQMPETFLAQWTRRTLESEKSENCHCRLTPLSSSQRTRSVWSSLSPWGSLQSWPHAWDKLLLCMNDDINTIPIAFAKRRTYRRNQPLDAISKTPTGVPHCFASRL